jgi:DNA-binding protein
MEQSAVEVDMNARGKRIGLIVQTTGRNIRETEKIAEILKTRFS